MNNIQTEIKPVKLALVIRNDFTDPKEEINLQSIITREFHFSDRETCETDEELLQIIPYIALVDTTGPKNKFFVYTRGKTSGEGRLIGKCSIGLGGHIDEPSAAINFTLAIADAASRELKEEVGLDISVSKFVSFICKTNGINTPYFSFNNADTFASSRVSILYNNETAVDRVHLGVAFAVNTTPEDLNNHELDVITRGQWLTYAEIKEAEQVSDNPIVLEEWSKMYLNILNTNLSNQLQLKI